MMYTDLALEAAELRTRELAPQGKLDGVVSRRETRRGFTLDRVEILDARGAALLEKPQGRYVTLDIGAAVGHDPDAFLRACTLTASLLRELLPEGNGGALVAGLGNRDLTPDAIGPACVKNVFVTRHMRAAMPELFERYRPVCAAAPGVLGTTGIETAEYLRALVDKLRPDFVIAADALMARRMNRLCTTVQITDTGVAPGSGLGGKSAKLDREYLGVPVIALGVPTIVDSATLAIDTMHDAGLRDLDEDALRRAGDATMRMARLSDDAQQRMQTEKWTDKQAAVLQLLEQTGTAAVREICYFCGVTQAVVKTLENKGMLVCSDEERLRMPERHAAVQPAAPAALSGPQQAVYDGLLAQMQRPEASAALLYGVTGSGKTQVYMNLIDRVLEEGRQAIVLVPEISLTPQMLQTFYARYGSRVAVLHSALSIGERMDEWKRIKRGMPASWSAPGRPCSPHANGWA